MKTLHLLAAGLFGLTLAAQQAPKNVIFFLGDGMGPATVTATRLFKVGEAGQLTMDTLARTAKIKTFSNDAQTTDSAPSMAAYMTGVKMNNEVISMSSDTVAIPPTADYTTAPGAKGTPVATLLELAKAKGKRVGAVTTTRVTHATPAATYAHVPHRDAEADIAAQAVPGGTLFNTNLGDGLDVLMGGGAKFFLPKADGGKRADGRNLVTELQAKGYTYVSTGSGLKGLTPATTGKVVGLFHMDHMDYELDRRTKALDQPSLADMATKAVDLLSGGSNGYFLMVEGGRIDHALHGTNARRVVEDTVAFDDAIKAVLDKVDLTNTLVVITADHDHTMTINGYSQKGNPILDIVRDYKTGQPALDADGNTYTALVFGNGPNRPDTRTSVVSGNADATQALHADYLQETGVRMPKGSETHGGGDVKLFATGAGSDAFKGTLENIKVFTLIKTAFGL